MHIGILTNSRGICPASVFFGSNPNHLRPSRHVLGNENVGNLQPSFTSSRHPHEPTLDHGTTFQRLGFILRQPASGVRGCCCNVKRSQPKATHRVCSSRLPTSPHSPPCPSPASEESSARAVAAANSKTNRHTNRTPHPTPATTPTPTPTSKTPSPPPKKPSSTNPLPRTQQPSRKTRCARPTSSLAPTSPPKTRQHQSDGASGTATAKRAPPPQTWARMRDTRVLMIDLSSRS